MKRLARRRGGWAAIVLVLASAAVLTGGASLTGCGGKDRLVRGEACSCQGSDCLECCKGMYCVEGSSGLHICQ